MPTKKLAKSRKIPGLPAIVYIGFSSDGAEIVATYCSRHEAEQFRQPGEIVSGPFVRIPKGAKGRLVRDVLVGRVF